MARRIPYTELTIAFDQHEVLAAVARRTNVLLCGHSNTERGYLPRLKVALEQALRDDGVDMSDTELLVSNADRDPLEVV